jgi:hypothetical protein
VPSLSESFEALTAFGRNTLVNRFHETNQIGRIALDATDLIPRSRAQHGVLRLSGTKDGAGTPSPMAGPSSFEGLRTPTFGRSSG